MCPTTFQVAQFKRVCVVCMLCVCGWEAGVLAAPGVGLCSQQPFEDKQLRDFLTETGVKEFEPGPHISTTEPRLWYPNQNNGPSGHWC